jgi:hypothetical protein
MDHQGGGVWFTKRGLAAYLRVSERSIERWSRRSVDPLPFCKPYKNGAIRYYGPDVDAWWLRNTAHPAPSVSDDRASGTQQDAPERYERCPVLAGADVVLRGAGAVVCRLAGSGRRLLP